MAFSQADRRKVSKNTYMCLVLACSTYNVIVWAGWKKHLTAPNTVRSIVSINQSFKFNLMKNVIIDRLKSVTYTQNNRSLRSINYLNIGWAMAIQAQSVLACKLFKGIKVSFKRLKQLYENCFFNYFWITFLCYSFLIYLNTIYFPYFFESIYEILSKKLEK